MWSGGIFLRNFLTYPPNISGLKGGGIEKCQVTQITLGVNIKNKLMSHKSKSTVSWETLKWSSSVFSGNFGLEPWWVQQKSISNIPCWDLHIPMLGIHKLQTTGRTWNFQTVLRRCSSLQECPYHNLLQLSISSRFLDCSSRYIRSVCLFQEDTYSENCSMNHTYPATMAI